MAQNNTGGYGGYSVGTSATPGPAKDQTPTPGYSTTPPSQTYAAPRSDGYRDAPAASKGGADVPSQGYYAAPSQGYNAASSQTYAAPRSEKGSNATASQTYSTPPSQGYNTAPSQVYNASSSQTYSAPPSQGYNASSNQTYSTPPSQGYYGPPSQAYSDDPRQRYNAASSQTYSTPPSQGYSAAPTQGYGAAPNQGYGAAPSQGYSAAPSQGYNPAPSQGYSAAPGQGYGAAPSQGYNPASRQGYDTASSQPYSAPPSQGYNSGPSQSYSTDPRQQSSAAPSQTYSTPPSQGYQGASSQSYKAPASQPYGAATNQGYGAAPNPTYGAAPSQTYGSTSYRTPYPSQTYNTGYRDGTDPYAMPPQPLNRPSASNTARGSDVYDRPPAYDTPSNAHGSVARGPYMDEASRRFIAEMLANEEREMRLSAEAIARLALDEQQVRKSLELSQMLEREEMAQSYLCPICDERKHLDQVCTIAACGHRLCVACLLNTLVVRDEMNEQLQCPHPDRGGACKAVVRSTEVKTILETAFGEPNYPKDPNGLLGRIQMRELSAAYRDSRERVECRGYDCNYFVLLADPDEALNIECGSCHQKFCSKCRELSHYHVPCTEISRLRSSWRAWNDRERQEYRQRMAEEEQRVQRDARDRSKRLEEFNNDETIKEQNCRLCPKCNNCIWREAGCASMICGQNYHGGNQQYGCGTHFNWETARPYQRTMAEAHPLTRAAIENTIAKARGVVHAGVACGLCRVSPIVGIRYQCIHCPSFNACEACETRLSTEHDRDHVFQILLSVDGAPAMAAGRA